MSTSAKRDLRGRRAACRKRRHRGICSFTPGSFGRQDRTSSLSSSQLNLELLQSTLQRTETGPGAAPVGSKVKCRLARLPLPADATTFISPKHFLTSTLSHSSISCWHPPTPTSSFQNPEVQPHQATSDSGSELRALDSARAAVLQVAHHGLGALI